MSNFYFDVTFLRSKVLDMFFTPAFQYFYTDISAISVTFRNYAFSGFEGCNGRAGLHSSTITSGQLPISRNQQQILGDCHQETKGQRLVSGKLGKTLAQMNWISDNLSVNLWWIFHVNVSATNRGKTRLISTYTFTGFASFMILPQGYLSVSFPTMMWKCRFNPRRTRSAHTHLFMLKQIYSWK